MNIYNDAGLALYILGEHSGTIRAQLCENRVQSRLAAAILESFHVYAPGIFGAEMLGEFHFAAYGIIVLDDASHKADDDYRMVRGSGGCGGDGGPVMALWNGGQGTGCDVERQQQSRRKRKGRESHRSCAPKT